MARDVFQEISGSINLGEALRRGSEHNDMLPPRLEDKVMGEVGRRFSEGLMTRLERGRYDPTPAELIFVPKPGFTTRPAALLTLPDRVVYEALVNSLRPRIDQAMVGSESVYWPRGNVSDKQWEKFEAGCLHSDPTHVALADVTAFYENIDHEVLRDVLIDLTGRKAEVDALIELLSRVMRTKKGLPQGLSASDPLATAYLTLLDHSMGRSGFDYHRHGDDIRIGCKGGGEARRVIHELERELRSCGLLLSSSKAFVTTADSYRDTLSAGRRLEDETRHALLDARIQELKGDNEKTAEFLERIGRRDLGWLFFYHSSMSFEEMVLQIRGHLTPSDVDVAANVFVDTMRLGLEGADSIPREVFHQRITSSLVRLAAGKSPIAIKSVKDLLELGPERTGVASNYLSALLETEGALVASEIVNILESERYKTSWEKSWLLQVLRRVVTYVEDSRLESITKISSGEGEAHIARVEAMKVLASRGVCDRVLLRHLWNHAPKVYRSDLVAAAFYARNSEPWCSAFLDSVKDDPIIVVVLRHLHAAVG